MATLQTLERGILALEEISRHPGGLTVAALAESLDVHRAIAYRVVATLAEHDLVLRGGDGCVRLGGGVAALAARVAPTLVTMARPVLRRLALDTSATSFLAIAEHQDCVVLAVDEPPVGVLGVGYRVGSRHPLTRGASGLAILAGRPENEGDDNRVRAARSAGHAFTRGEINAGAVGVACPVGSHDHGIEASLGVVTLEGLDEDAVTAAVRAAVRELRRQPGSD